MYLSRNVQYAEGRESANPFVPFKEQWTWAHLYLHASLFGNLSALHALLDTKYQSSVLRAIHQPHRPHMGHSRHSHPKILCLSDHHQLMPSQLHQNLLSPKHLGHIGQKL